MRPRMSLRGFFREKQKQCEGRIHGSYLSSQSFRCPNHALPGGRFCRHHLVKKPIPT